ncbi:MAG: hypothetical protein IJX14_08930 [Clostridia bacterium]|nr:hypothetical protein [Clostridia bacterium]
MVQIQQKLCTQTIDLPEAGRTTYTLTEDILPTGERCYSISIVLDSPAGTESRTVRDVTGDRELALRLFWMLCRGTVTPCTLTEVLPELLP